MHNEGISIMLMFAKNSFLGLLPRRRTASAKDGGITYDE